MSYYDDVAKHRFADALRTQAARRPAHRVADDGQVETPGAGKYAYGFGDNTTSGLRCVGITAAHRV